MADTGSRTRIEDGHSRVCRRILARSDFVKSVVERQHRLLVVLAPNNDNLLGTVQCGSWWVLTTYEVAVGIAAATGVEWVINLVFVELDRTQIGMLRAGPLGTAFLAASLIFLLGSILYCSALLRDGKAPR
jgi:hypothetical protein